MSKGTPNCKGDQEIKSLALTALTVDTSQRKKKLKLSVNGVKKVNYKSIKVCGEEDRTFLGIRSNEQDFHKCNST